MLSNVWSKLHICDSEGVRCFDLFSSIQVITVIAMLYSFIIHYCGYIIMPRQSLLPRAQEIYSEDGLSQLMNSTYAYTRKRVREIFRNSVEVLIRRRAEIHRRQINLNGVTVSIDISWVDKHFPYYEPSYPTRSNPEYESTLVELIKTYVRSGDSVTVIGGGLGVTTVVASKSTDERVTVFEQSKSTYEILTRTIELNGCSDNTNTQLKTVGEPAFSNFSYSSPDTDRISPSELPYADVYEMDCEGAEITILRQMNVRPSTLLIKTHNNHNEVYEI
jgi:hypothetical protein